MSGYGLGRLEAKDPKDNNYLMTSYMPEAVKIVDKTWKTLGALNQGRKPHCVGFAWRSFLTSEPLRSRHTINPSELYREAQDHDEWPGNNYDGTSVRGGAKALQARGLIDGHYVWGKTIDDVRNYVISRGTVIVGTIWTTKMFTPRQETTSRFWIEPGGFIEGGHAYEIYGFIKQLDAFKVLNSWGPEWAWRGRALMHASVLGYLLNQAGEACSAIQARHRRGAP